MRFCAKVAAVVVWALVVGCSAGAVAGPWETAEEVRYREVDLVASDLSLRDDSSLADLPPIALAATGAGGGNDFKNPMVAVLMSLVLPGWGELYAGHTAPARAFMTAEAGIWVGYAAFEVQGNMREDDYREHAAIFAGVDEDAGSGYLQDIADYIRSEGDDSFNESVRSEARSLYPDDLGAQETYFLENGYFDDQSWEWESEERFDKYRVLRHGASTSNQNAFYMTGLAVLNRAVSAIDAAWMARRHNEGTGGGPSARLTITPDLADGVLGSRATLEFSF